MFLISHTAIWFLLLISFSFPFPINTHNIIRIISKKEWNECRHLSICNVYVVSLSHTCHWVDVILMRDVSNPHPFNICFIHFLNSCSRNSQHTHTLLHNTLTIRCQFRWIQRKITHLIDFIRTKWNGMNREKKTANNNVPYTVSNMVWIWELWCLFAARQQYNE